MSREVAVPIGASLLEVTDSAIGMECDWCIEPITDGNFAIVVTHLYTDGDELKMHWNVYHWTPQTYMQERGCLWHSEQ